LEKIVEESIQLCSETTRQSFIASQQVSIAEKIKQSKLLIKQYFLLDKINPLTLISCLCKLWEVFNSLQDDMLSLNLFNSMIRSEMNNNVSEHQNDPWTEELKTVFIDRFMNYLGAATVSKDSTATSKGEIDSYRLHCTALAIAWVVSLSRLYLVIKDREAEELTPEFKKECIGIAFSNFTTASLADYRNMIVTARTNEIKKLENECSFICFANCPN